MKTPLQELAEVQEEQFSMRLGKARTIVEKILGESISLGDRALLRSIAEQSLNDLKKLEIGGLSLFRMEHETAARYLQQFHPKKVNLFYYEYYKK